jgi:thioredoxin reductase (NADPH)
MTLGTRVVGMTYDPATGLKHVTLSNGDKVDARTVVLAGGVTARKAEYPGSEGPGVFYGAKQLAAATVGKNAVVVGGSNGAAQAALGCAQTCNHVDVLARSGLKGMSEKQASALASNPRISIITGDEIGSIERGKDNNISAIVTVGGKRLEASGLGLFIGGVPDTKWLPPDVAKDKGGRVVTDANMETNVPGVYAVGDMRAGAIGRIGVAVGQGQMAIWNVFQYFDKLKAAAKPAAGSAPNAA